MLIPKPEIFGNYLLKGFNSIILPKPISFFPQTLSAWLLIVGISLLFIGFLGWLGYRWHKNAYRRKAISLLRSVSEEEATALVPHLLRKVAAETCLGNPVSALNGIEWISFLNRSTKQALFTPRIQQHLQVVSFQPPCGWQDEKELNTLLVDSASKWIKIHHKVECKIR
ncbi:hypothetical protein VIN01S_30550 [Vibrio inusitatus NBRC 102082]|uniref:DUF4381 domain-containing protein n=1 Tax=Vibrio inusitatus NBRC 102082 TaxID=1219070 RepID=A0A4Y3HZ08_9VIBR|nr:DUF4381 domain-containing protein [Vibrio inusitatus]GEA52251.1 hypothetical protein VIN01S_30550 [Vibrio inusitatus NBRC 102082]